MKITEVKDLSKYLIGALPVGRGTTAICFYMPNGKLLKLYYKEAIKIAVMEKIELLDEIGNDSFISPEEILIKDGKCVAQIYEYICAPTLSSIRSRYNVSDILNAYDKLISDTKIISDKGLLLVDLHDKNILFDGLFYIIDIDKVESEKSVSKDKVFLTNVKSINQVILHSLFKLKYYEIIDFPEPEMQHLYYKSRCDYDKFKLLLERIINDTSNSKIKRISKKIKHEKYIDSYRF